MEPMTLSGSVRRMFAIAPHQARKMARFDQRDILSEDFDDNARSIEEQIVNNYAINLEEEARISEAGHVW